MNPAIVAPDGFDIIDMTAGGQINSDQRRNLGSVAKVLQHAASNKLFEGENEHLSSMNNYLSETYQKFRWEESLLLEKLARWWARAMCVLCSELEFGGGGGQEPPLASCVSSRWHCGAREGRAKQARSHLSAVSHPTPVPSAPDTESYPYVRSLLLTKWDLCSPWYAASLSYLELKNQNSWFPLCWT